MTVLIIIFGALTLLAGAVILINPEIIFGYLRGKIDRLGIHILAVTVRLILGVLLVQQSSQSRFPLAIEVLGWLSVIAAVLLALCGRQNFQRLMAWALTFLKPYGRIGGIIAAIFGGFLVYAFV